MNTVNWNTWNPALEEDYQIEDKKSNANFSSLERNCFVAEGVGDFRWDAKKNLVCDLFTKTSSNGFFLHHAWGQKSLDCLHNYSIISQQAEIKGRSISGQLNAKNLSILLTAWYESGAYESGEWYFFGFSKPSSIQASAFEKTGLVHMLNEFQNLNFFLELYEMKQSMLLVKSLNGIDKKLIDLISL